MPETEADTCRRYVLPKLYKAGWTDEQINEQHTFTGELRPIKIDRTICIPLTEIERYEAHR